MRNAGIIFIVVLLLVLVGCCCSNETAWEAGTNFEVSNAGSIESKEFQYQVFDNQHNIIDSGCTDNIEPIFYANNGFLRLSLDYGSGATEYRYYDVSKGLVSELYRAILSDRITNDGILVAYLTHEDDTVVVAIQDAFDEKAFYKTIKGEFPIIFSPSTQAEFISDNQLRLTYLTGEDYDEKIELITFK
ncbi:MAG: hypothetical protein E7559_10795 [Ruminococcaceae bacterium]|nr:hypothetical protein [Oscillospiraceae bacterium]